MPNSRRRRFSVQKEIRERDVPKLQSGTQISQQYTKEDITFAVTPYNSTKPKNKLYGRCSKSVSPLKIIVEHESSTSTIDDKNKKTFDKDATASSSNIDFYSMFPNDDVNIGFKDVINDTESESIKKRDARQFRTDRTRYDRHPHRIKVRSPKRKVSSTDRINKISFTVHALNLDQGVQAQDLNDRISSVSEPSEEYVDSIPILEHEIPTSPSLEDMCRICHGGESLSSEFGQMISACLCRGTVGRVHVKCLERWLTESGKSKCELCGTRYATQRVHRYGILKAFMLWALSQNAKQLMVDSLGIMLMSPLAVLAAWLSGRTLAGLMTHDTHITPWPLASTFVLACMTLVCYYCWIVSAATRHALAWWIWYRSQYEVRLQLQE